MAKKLIKQKRKINAGLKAWNEARSFFSKQNKLAGKKYNGVELNALTKSFLFEHYGASFDSNDLNRFIKVEVPRFFNNPINLTLDKITPTPYYMMDFKIRDLGVGMDVSVLAGDFGDLEFNTTDYNYYNGLSEIVEKIRKHLNPTGATKSPNDSNGMFDGSIKLKHKASKDSKEPNDYFVEWVLFIDNEYVSDIKGTIIPKPSTEEDKIFKIKIKKTKKGSGKIPPKSKTQEPKAEPTLSSKEIIDIEKAKQKTMSKLVAVEKAKQKTMDKVLQLLKAGFTKQEINKLLNIN
jgi:hypothetical protein